MTVSLCIIARNEEKVIGGLLEQVKNQTYPKDKTEIVLVDSGSTDGTKGIFEKFAEENKSEYIDVKIGDNTGGNQATGWNAAIKIAMGDVIIRVDAHAEIPENFIEKNVEGGAFIGFPVELLLICRCRDRAERNCHHCN